MFSEKVIIVTGASSGIGAVISKQFAKEKASLAITGRNRENLEKVAEECMHAGAKEVLQIIADQSKLGDLEKIIDETIKKFGQLNILVNSAGIFGFIGAVEATPVEKFDSVFHINTRALFYLIQLAIPHLEITQGNIVTISSLASQSTIPGCASAFSSMSKAASDHLVRMAALEFAPKGIRINAVSPGAVNTNLAINAGMPQAISDEMFAAEERNHPLGLRNVAPEEVADVVLFLASSKAAAVTGRCLLADRGRCLTGK